MGSSLNRSTYDQIKQQLQHLKLEQKELQECKARALQVESAAILQLRQEHQQGVQQQQQEILSLQQRLKDTVERAAKTRQHAERENASLTKRITQLQGTLDHQQQQHEQRAHELQSEHEAALESLRAQAAAADQAWATKCQEEAARSSKFIKDVEDWCSGEVEAIQAASAERLEKEQQQVAHWQTTASGLQQQLEAEQREKAGLQAEVQAAAARCCALEAQLQQVTAALGASQEQLQQQQAVREQEREQWRLQLERQEEAAQAQLLQAKQRFASEMDLVKDKLQLVLAKKDSVIAGLRQELQDVSRRLAQAEQLMLGLGTDS